MQPYQIAASAISAMPRKDYKDDLAVITACPPQGIEAVVEDGDGEFDFAFALGQKQTKVVVHAMIPGMCWCTDTSSVVTQEKFSINMPALFPLVP